MLGDLKGEQAVAEDDADADEHGTEDVQPAALGSLAAG
jgi:hypothetical protein